MIIPRTIAPAPPLTAAAGTKTGKTSSYTVRLREEAIRYLRKQGKEYRRKYGAPGSHARGMKELFQEISRSFG